jgi:hypothetical protein
MRGFAKEWLLTFFVVAEFFAKIGTATFGNSA